MASGWQRWSDNWILQTPNLTKQDTTLKLTLIPEISHVVVFRDQDKRIENAQNKMQCKIGHVNESQGRF